MKKVNLYECEICGSRYETPTKASQCEFDCIDKCDYKHEEKIADGQIKIMFNYDRWCQINQHIDVYIMRIEPDFTTTGPYFISMTDKDVDSLISVLTETKTLRDSKMAESQTEKKRVTWS